ncbi:hypothetical protein BDF14DRAFT_1748958 [Spinellus fusiger]|nr:hypothetical protein BDF14DRAFT_1748958 [Spinellus fusiger]
MSKQDPVTCFPFSLLSEPVSMNTIAKRLIINKATERFNKPSVITTDEEIIAAMNEAAGSKKRRWWNSTPTPDIILSEHERETLRAVKNRAFYLDKGINCCCCQVGIDPLVGFIPVVGDAIGVVLALQVVRMASQADIPRSLLLQMLGNVGIDFIVGLTPIAGDILDILFKCNWRNAELLEEYLLIRRRDQIRAEKGLIHHALPDQHRKTYAEATASTSTAPTFLQQDTVASHSQEPTHGTAQQTQPKKSGYGTFLSWLHS